MERSEFTKGQIKKFLTYMISFKSIYNKYSGNYIPVNGSCYCPFHDNSNTKAAKFFEESNSLHCWGACGKNFYVYDLLELYNIDPVETFYKLWDSYDDVKKETLRKQVGNSSYQSGLLYKDALIAYDSGLISYEEFGSQVYSTIDGLKDPLILLYNISRRIDTSNLDKLNDYQYLGAFPKNVHIRTITSGEIFRYTKSLTKSIVSFISEQGDVTILFNMCGNLPVGAVIRSNKSKEFRDVSYGVTFYNFLNLKNFKHGDPIFIVEGPKDCEAFNIYFKHKYACIALMGATLSRDKVTVLRGLTDTLVFCLDNDETGRSATEKLIKSNSKFFDIHQIKFPKGVKDFGDLITLYRKNNDKFKAVYSDLKQQVDSFNL